MLVEIIIFVAVGSQSLVGANNSTPVVETSPLQFFDAAFPDNTSQLSYVTTDEDFTFPGGMVNISVCFWLKPSALTQHSVFTYTVYPTPQYGNLFGWFIEPQIKTSWLCIYEDCMEMGAPEVQVDLWHHFCVMYDGTHANIKLVYNGKQTFEKIGKRNKIYYRMPGGGILVLGQDQDTYGGGFDAAQSMRGKITGLQMWDRLLDTEEVERQLKCDAPEGNIISWSTTPWIFLNGATNMSSSRCSEVEEQFSLDTEDPAPALNLDCHPEEITDLQNAIRILKNEAQTNMTRLQEIVRDLKKADDEIVQELDILHGRNDWFKDDEDVLYKKDITNLKQQLADLEKQHEKFVWKMTKELKLLKEEIRQSRTSFDPAKTPCPTDFVAVQDRCYYFSNYVRNDWNEALKECQAMTSSLLSLETRDEWLNIQQYLRSRNMRTTHWWTGGTDAAREGNWTWINDSMPVRFLPWCANEPNEGKGENCLHLREVNDGWCYNDLPCKNPGTYNATNFICEADPVNSLGVQN